MASLTRNLVRDVILPHESACVNRNLKHCSCLDGIFHGGAVMQGALCRKAYVSVNVDIDVDGSILPRLIRWGNGKVFQIDRIKYKCRASSDKVGGGGIRYTVIIRGQESFLFQEGSKWFVEAKEGTG